MRVNDVAARENHLYERSATGAPAQHYDAPKPVVTKVHRNEQNMVADWAREVIALQSAGKITEALALVEARLAVCTDDGRAALLAAKAVVLAARGDLRDALSVATAAREAARLADSQPAMADAGLSLAFVLQMLEEHRRAIDIASECDQIGREYGDESLRFRAQRLLANSYSVIGRHEQAISMLRAVIAHLAADSESSGLQLYWARLNLLRAEDRQLQASTSEQHVRRLAFRSLYERWHSFADEMSALQLVRLQAIALAKACHVVSELGDDQFALASHEASLPLLYSVGLRSNCAETEYQYGVVLSRLGRFGEARDALQRSIALLDGHGPRILALAWDALSTVFEALDLPYEALSSLKQARHFERQLRDGEALVAATLAEQRVLIDRLSDEWSRLASEDPLTGFANRRAFDRQLAAMTDAVNGDSRAGAAFALAFFDLDRFKLVNDAAGHGVGDTVLKRFAAILSSGRRGNDMVARLGGDEFAILFAGVRAGNLGGILDSLVTSVHSENWAAIDSSLRLTVSAGAVHTDEISASQRTPTSLLRVADERLYEAKRNGRNRAVVGF